jgi:hypothetical protein
VITLAYIVGGIAAYALVVLFVLCLCSINGRLPDLTDMALGKGSSDDEFPDRDFWRSDRYDGGRAA